ncbi:MAG: Mg-chelatase subunit ChlD [Polyangiales bacterium]|jgi:Mg-chelatase subunit ChlD
MRSVLVFSFILAACGSDDRRAGDAALTDAALTDVAASDALRDVSRTDTRGDVPEAVCETLRAQAEPVAATLLFQVDTSNSMNCAVTNPTCLTGDPTPAPDDSRWDVFTTELRAALASVPDAATVGLMRFPQAERACTDNVLTSELAPLVSSRAMLRSAIAGITPDGLATPTHDAVAFGLERLASLGAERPFLVLATDGAASVCLGCDTDCAFDSPEPLRRDEEALIARVEDAAAAGIPTFVIGVPGSQSFRSVLSRLASAGDTARMGCSDTGPTYCHYDLTDSGLDFAAALREALATIGESLLSCEYEIPPNPDGTFDPLRVNVRISGGGEDETIPRDDTREAGWDYSDSMERVELYGDACTRARRAETLEILFGCPTLLI